MRIHSVSASTLRFAFQGSVPFLSFSREEGLDLLEWLGLGRPEFGAIEASELRPLCRRRLWPEARNHLAFKGRDAQRLRALAQRIIDAVGNDSGTDATVCFG